jgi:hypothetical protein
MPAVKWESGSLPAFFAPIPVFFLHPGPPFLYLFSVYGILRGRNKKGIGKGLPDALKPETLFFTGERHEKRDA